MTNAPATAPASTPEPALAPLPLDGTAWPEMVWVLRLSVGTMALALAAKTLPILGFLGVFTEPTKFNNVLFSYAQWPETVLNPIDAVFAGACLLAGAAAWAFRRAWPLLPILSVWVAANAVADAYDGTWYPYLILPSSAVRIAGPIALMLLLMRPQQGAIPAGRVRAVEWLLRVAVALTFAGHGFEAMFGRAGFIDYILRADTLFLGDSMTEATARQILWVIGLVDVGIAGAILLPTKMRTVAAWMVFWGLLTAAARVVQSGPLGVPEMLLRVIHGGAPMALLLYWQLHLMPASSPAKASAPPPTTDAPGDSPLTATPLPN